MAKWFYIIDGQEAGPIEPAVLKHIANPGRLKPQDKVRREDMAEWRQAREVKGLFSGAASANSSSPQAPTMTAAPPATERFASSTSDGNGTGASATPNSDSATADGRDKK